MLGDKNEPSKLLSTPKRILLVLAALKVFAATIAFSSSSLKFHRYHSVEKFVPFGLSTTRIHRRATSDPCTSSSDSIFIPNMTSRHDDDNGGRSTADNQGRSQGNRQQRQQQQQKDRRRQESTTNAAPMYITIGPQCCGKSSFLRKYKEGTTIKDISLDDQQDVYVPISTETFLHAYDKGESGDTNTDDDVKREQLLQQVYQGKSLKERIRENVELILILRRWNGDSTASDFERRIKNYYEERKLPEDVATELVKAVEDFLSNQPSLPKETDVFILESLFKPHPQTRQSAIQRAHEELRETPRHIPVAWGNTNSKPKDYERALEICHQTRRPVHFILCHPAYGSDDGADGTTNNESELMTLPWLPLEELLKRNLHRLQTQGRFIPAFAIADCCQRVAGMIPTNVAANAGNDGPGNKRIEEHLVAIASPSTGGRGPPRRNDNRRPGATFRYSLTKHRLVQKEYPRHNDTRYSSSSNQRQNHQNRNSNRYNDGRDPRHGNQGRYTNNDNTDNRRRYDGEDNNGGYRNQGRPLPSDKEDAPPRARRRYNN